MGIAPWKVHTRYKLLITLEWDKKPTPHTPLTAEIKTDLKGLVGFHTLLSLTCIIKTDKSLIAPLGYLCFTVANIGNHSFLFLFLCPASSQLNGPPTSRTKSEYWEKHFASSFVACWQCILCIWTDSSMMVLSSLLVLMASCWWPRAMTRCHLNSSVWKHHCRTTVL